MEKEKAAFMSLTDEQRAALDEEVKKTKAEVRRPPHPSQRWRLVVEATAVATRRRWRLTRAPLLISPCCCSRRRG